MEPLFYAKGVIAVAEIANLLTAIAGLLTSIASLLAVLKTFHTHRRRGRKKPKQKASGRNPNASRK